MKKGNFEIAKLYLTLFGKNYESAVQAKNQNNVNQVLLPYNIKLDDIENVSVDNHLLNLINKSEREDLIDNPTTKYFLDKKWKGIPRILYYIHLILYVAFLILYIIHLELFKKNHMKIEFTFSNTPLIALNVLLIVISAFFFFEELIQVGLLKKAYWKDIH